MFCKNCGKPLQPDEKFCLNCGQVVTAQPGPAASGPAEMPFEPHTGTTQYPTPEGKKKGKKGKLALILLCVVLVLGGAAIGYFLLGGPAGRNWSDPDQLAGECIAAIQARDVDRIVSMSDIPEQLKYYDWMGMVQRLGVVQPNMLFLSDSPAIQQVAEYKLNDQLTDALYQIWNNMFGGSSPVAECISQWGVIRADDLTEGQLQEYQTMIGEEDLSQVPYTIFQCNWDAEEMDLFLEGINESNQDAVIGYREYAVLFNNHNSYSIAGITLYQYGDGWKLHNFDAVRSGIGSQGGDYLPDLEGSSPEEARQYILENYHNLTPVNG